jgi:predicted lipid carrier protein YhbT
MADVIATFLTRLQERSPEPLLSKANGTVRFDMTDDEGAETWYVHLRHGEIEVARESDVEATSRVHGSKRLFEAMCDGSANATAAMLRNEFTLEGDAELLLLLQRVFPGPATSTHPRASAGTDA